MAIWVSIHTIPHTRNPKVRNLRKGLNQEDTYTGVSENRGSSLDLKQLDPWYEDLESRDPGRKEIPTDLESRNL